MAVYRLRPHVIEAIQYKGKYSDDIIAFLGGVIHRFDNAAGIYIATLDGVVLVTPYMWIVKDKIITNGVGVFEENQFNKMFEPVSLTN